MCVKLLVVDDDEIVHFMVKRNLRSLTEEISSRFYYDGKQAIEFLSQIESLNELPDCILLDLNMPTFDGWDFLQQFDKLKSSIKEKVSIYILSSSLDPNDILKAKSFETVDGYINKPINKESLLKLIKEKPKDNVSS
jgi:CheY-like chemotaxis protein